MFKTLLYHQYKYFTNFQKLKQKTNLIINKAHITKIKSQVVLLKL